MKIRGVFLQPTVYLWASMRLIIIYMLLLGGSLLSAQNRFTLSGEITDSETGEDLVGATVYMAGTSLGGVSNSYGFYSLTVPGGKQELVCSYIGYEEFRVAIELKNDRRLNISLMPKSTQLEEVVVSAERADKNLSSVEIGVEKLDVS